MGTFSTSLGGTPTATASSLNGAVASLQAPSGQGIAGGSGMDMGFRDQPLNFSENKFFFEGVNTGDNSFTQFNFLEIGFGGGVGYTAERAVTTASDGSVNAVTSEKVSALMFAMEGTTNPQTGITTSTFGIEVSLPKASVMGMIIDVDFKIPLITETYKSNKR